MRDLWVGYAWQWLYESGSCLHRLRLSSLVLALARRPAFAWRCIMQCMDGHAARTDNSWSQLLCSSSFCSNAKIMINLRFTLCTGWHGSLGQRPACSATLLGTTDLTLQAAQLSCP